MSWRFAPRDADRPILRPPQARFGLDDPVPFGVALGLAIQHMAIQAVYLVLPTTVAASFGLGPRAATNFVCLSILAFALLAVLQALRRGPVGAGYQMPALPTPVMVGAYLLCAGAGLGLDQAGALLVLAGLAAAVLTLLIRRPQALMPPEIAGVVVFLLGVALLPVMVDLLEMAHFQATPHAVHEIGVTLACFLVMVAVALSRSAAAPFGVLIGALAGLPMMLLVPGPGVDLMAVLAANPWLAVPEPVLPRFEALPVGLALGFAFAVLPAKATILGNLVALQRAADAGWRRPDGGPLSRGLLAHAVALMAAGGFGGMAPGPSSACVGLSIANRTLARSIAVVGALLLAALAFSPKLVSVFVAIPSPVKAAMLLYVACFMIATGCQLITIRMLDTRRSLVVGVGLIMGFAVLIAPTPFRDYLPALASALTFGALSAFVFHLLTLPFVRRRASLTLALDTTLHEVVETEMRRLGGAWGARRTTMDKVENLLIELGEVLARRGQDRMRVAASHLDEQVQVTIRHDGPPLPAPASTPDVGDLDGPVAQQEAFILWLATRQAATLHRRPGEWQLAFEDT